MEIELQVEVQRRAEECGICGVRKPALDRVQRFVFHGTVDAHDKRDDLDGGGLLELLVVSDGVDEGVGGPRYVSVLGGVAGDFDVDVLQGGG